MEATVQELLGVFRYEYHMSTRRKSLWLAFGFLALLYLTPAFTPPGLSEIIPAEDEVLSFAGTIAFALNLFMPVAGGILAADRLVRDQKLGVGELLHSTPLRLWPYLLGKYFGVLCSIATPVLLSSLLWGAKAIIAGAPADTLPALLLSFLGMNLPTYVFIIAFSLACPLVMPVRVYQVLFTGYWFWGNFISPEFMPTINGTYLTASGHYPLLGLFGGFFGGGGPNYATHITRADALINLAVLAACAGLALLAADRLLAWQAKHA
jgi:ABC-type transport system involved in multi-copper enzyme maturation permease subunit